MEKSLLPDHDMETHRIIQCSRHISSIKRWVKGQILPELSLQLIKIHIAGVAEPAGKTVWRQMSITNPASSYYDCHVDCSHEKSVAWWFKERFTLLQVHLDKNQRCKLTCPGWRSCGTRWQSLAFSGCCIAWIIPTGPSPPAGLELELPDRQCHRTSALASSLQEERPDEADKLSKG